MNRLAAFFAAALVGGACAAAAELNVFAAASLSDALTELAPRFQAATGHKLRYNFGASGTLVRQIREGASADVIFTADELRLGQLDQAGLLRSGTRRPLLANQLVVVVAAEGGPALVSVADLVKPGIRFMAIGEPASVPAGTYAQEYLAKLGLWERIRTKLVPLENVRAVLAAVASGNADAGFVYQTDALISRKVKIALRVPRAEGPSIVYPAAVLRDARSPEAAGALLQFLAGPAAQTVFRRLGFLAAD